MKLRLRHIYIQTMVTLLFTYIGLAQISNFSVTYNPPGRIAVEWFYTQTDTVQAYIIERRETGAKELWGDSPKHMVFLARDNTGPDITWNLGAEENIPFTTGGFQGLVFYYITFHFERIAYIETTGSKWVRYFDTVGHIGAFEYRLVKVTDHWEQIVCSDTLNIRYAVFLPNLAVAEPKRYTVPSIKYILSSSVFAVTIQ